MRDTIGRSIAIALGGHKAGVGWMARCPAHDDREPSLSIREADDGKVLVHCHAGCEQHRVIAALRSRGLWALNGIASKSAGPHGGKKQRDPDDNKRKKERSCDLAVRKDCPRYGGRDIFDIARDPSAGARGDPLA
jgi:hypothetical protein